MLYYLSAFTQVFVALIAGYFKQLPIGVKLFLLVLMLLFVYTCAAHILGAKVL